MPSYRLLDPAEYAVGSLVKQEVGDAWANNPAGIAAGVAGAPRFQLDALDIDIVKNAIARDSSAGDIGTYAFLRPINGKASVSFLGFGTLLDGSELSPAGMYLASVLETIGQTADSGTAVQGVWKCMGYGSPSYDPTTLWLRVS